MDRAPALPVILFDKRNAQLTDRPFLFAGVTPVRHRPSVHVALKYGILVACWYVTVGLTLVLPVLHVLQCYLDCYLYSSNAQIRSDN